MFDINETGDRLEPPERDSQLEETLGSSALHSEYYNEETRSEIVASNPWQYLSYQISGVSDIKDYMIP